jgi:hypothetical protein
VPLTLVDIEERLYDMSFDPNHPPELRWGAPADSAERASAPDRYTPLPNGERIPMAEAYLWESYYRCLGQRETGMSALKGMFTEGFPVRKKLDQQLAKWFLYDRPVVMAAAASSPAPAPTAKAAPAKTATPARNATPASAPKSTSKRIHVLVPHRS